MRTLRPARYLVVSLLLLCTACINREVSAPIGEEVSSEPVLLVMDAYRSTDQYFLRYRRGPDIFYAAGNLKGRGAADAADTNVAYQDPDVRSLTPDAPDNWEALTHTLTPIPILGVDAWSEFRDQVFPDVMSAGKNTGIAVSFERGDYFFFYDREGRFRARRLIDKPPWYEVSAHLDLQQHFERWQPALEQFLKSQNVSGREVLFNTGDLEPGAIPFIYINTANKLIILIRYDELPDELQGSIPGSHWLQSLWHFVGSHSYSVPMRPFSSAQSLVSLVSDTALESGKSLLVGMPLDVIVPPLSEGVHMDLQDWEQEVTRRLGRPSSRGELDFLVDGESFFPRFIDAVTSASESVDVRAYIFDNDDFAMTIAELLKRRSNEGIETRVLFDGLGTIIAGGETSQSLPKEHRPPLSIQAHLQTNSAVAVRSVKNTWLMGDHVKTMVIDSHQAFLGGMNIGREYRYDWHDLMVEVSGPIVDEINREFDTAWSRAGLFGDFAAFFSGWSGPVNESAQGYPLRLIYTRPGQQEIYALQREAIRRAKGYIYIENAYFTDDMLLRELILARRRGVDVRVVIPLETDQGLMTRNIIHAANIMHDHGIRVFIYPGFTHAKAAIFDGWACVGSANLDRLSLKINQEINIATSEETAVQELLDELFLVDFEKSRELTEPFPEQWNDRLIELFGDYIF